MEKTILLVEDEESLRRGVSLKLKREGYTVHAAGNLREAQALFAEHAADLVICDVGLPDGSGLDFCRRLRAAGRDVLFLFLTALDTELDIVNGYDAGADDYVTKPFSLMVLLSKVAAMTRRAAGPGLIRSGEITLAAVERRVWRCGELLTLTPNEYKLLDLFMHHSCAILSRQQLLECLWDADSPYIDDNAVAVNIRRLREKIERDPSAPIYIKNVRGMGYVWDQECTKE